MALSMRLDEFNAGEGNTLGSSDAGVLSYNSGTKKYQIIPHGGGIAAEFDDKDAAVASFSRSEEPNYLQMVGREAAPTSEYAIKNNTEQRDAQLATGNFTEMKDGSLRYDQGYNIDTPDQLGVNSLTGENYAAGARSMDEVREAEQFAREEAKRKREEATVSSTDFTGQSNFGGISSLRPQVATDARRSQGSEVQNYKRPSFPQSTQPLPGMQSFTGMPSFTERQGNLYKEQIKQMESAPAPFADVGQIHDPSLGAQAANSMAGLPEELAGPRPFPDIRAQVANPKAEFSTPIRAPNFFDLNVASPTNPEFSAEFFKDRGYMGSDAAKNASLTGIASVAPEGSYQAEFLRLKAENPNDPRYAGEVPDYVSPEQQELSAVNPNDPRYNSGIMSQAPSSMTDPSVMDLMRSPMDRGPMNQSPSQQEQSPFGGSFSNYLTGGYGGGNMGGFGGGTSGFGAMGTGMSAGGGIMSMANPMQEQMSMMPQQMMNQGGYAPKSAPSSGQSLYGSTTSTNNQQSIYGQQQFNSPFAGASRGYYA